MKSYRTRLTVTVALVIIITVSPLLAFILLSQGGV